MTATYFQKFSSKLDQDKIERIICKAESCIEYEDFSAKGALNDYLKDAGTLDAQQALDLGRAVLSQKPINNGAVVVAAHMMANNVPHHTQASAALALALANVLVKSNDHRRQAVEYVHVLANKFSKSENAGVKALMPATVRTWQNAMASLGVPENRIDMGLKLAQDPGVMRRDICLALIKDGREVMQPSVQPSTFVRIDGTEVCVDHVCTKVKNPEVALEAFLCVTAKAMKDYPSLSSEAQKEWGKTVDQISPDALYTRNKVSEVALRVAPVGSLMYKKASEVMAETNNEVEKRAKNNVAYAPKFNLG